MTGYFLDTYALIEILRGNDSYKGFVELDMFTSIFNLYELHFILLRSFGKEVANKHFCGFRSIVIEIEDFDVFLASRFKLDNKGVSYPDALGYAMAMNRELKFLTGDNFFKDLKNVEFVK
jgi:hypothetical protein